MPSPNKKLGKLAPKHNPKTLMFNKYLLPKALPPAPSKVFWEYKIPQPKWGMFGNDRIGDCTCAAIAHMLMNWTAHTGSMITPSEEEIISVYSAISGYDKDTGQNDNGAAITDVLAYWQKNGISGHKIDGWVQIDHTNLESVRQAIYLFGGLDIGVNLPNSAMDQTNDHKTWEVVADDGGIDGGHCIVNFGYGAGGTTVVTWGDLQPIAWDWFKAYCDEAYAVVSLDWLDKSGIAPNHLNVAALRADLLALKT